MQHPFEYCASRYCCFCIYLGQDATCYIIAAICIILNGFSAMTNFGIGHWALYLISILNLVLQLAAGILLFLGTTWGREQLKLAYCWLLFLGIFMAVLGLILYVVYHKEAYTIWGEENMVVSDIIVVFHTAWLVVWSIYTPMVVLGNLGEEEED